MIRRPRKGQDTCNTDEYEASGRERQESEARTLASLTGWDLDEIRAKIPFMGRPEEDAEEVSWWKKLWQ